MSIPVWLANQPILWSGGQQVNAGTPSGFTYYAYDLLSGRFLGAVPFFGVTFGQQLNAPGQFNGSLNIDDPRVQATDPINCTIPNRTLIAVDYGGWLVWAGIVSTRKRTVSASGSSTTRVLTVQASEMWSYFNQRVQATDYSAPPTSGIVSPMSFWTATPWDATLIAAQVINDAIGYSDSITNPFTQLLGGWDLKINGASPSGSSPVVQPSDYVAVNYPWTTSQTVGTIVTQLSQLGLGVGFDFGVDVAYSSGVASAPVPTINISYPRRGRTAAQSNLVIDLSLARQYEFPEDGTQSANQVFEIGGSGAIVVTENVFPLDQGYPLWERVMSRANAQSQNIIALLSQVGTADLAAYSYPVVTPTATLSINDPNVPLGSFTVGDDLVLFMPVLADDGNFFDARFPAGLIQEWRIVEWLATVADQGDSTVAFTFNQPPFTQALAPAV